MSEPARQPMSFEDFLIWDDGADTRYEFVIGEPVAMDPTSGRHGRIQRNAGRAIEDALDPDGPCIVVDQAGIFIENGSEQRYYIADVVMTGEPVSDDPIVKGAKLIVEVLSRSTRGIDRGHKVPHYATIPSVEEIWLIESRSRWVMTWQRVEGQWIGSVPFVKDASFRSRVLDADIALDRLYRNTGL